VENDINVVNDAFYNTWREINLKANIHTL